ncbi:MAG: ABC transporter substrate-binding protein [Acidimicrobiales bacterium]
MRRHSLTTALVMVTVAALAAACGSSTKTSTGSANTGSANTGSTGSGSGKCASTTNLTFQLNWVLDYEQVPYYVAKNKGFYAQHCLNVTIEPGTGSVTAVTTVASGAADMGVSDTVAVMQGQAKHLPVTGLGVVWKQNPFAIIIRKAALHGNTNPTPTSLTGLTFGAVTTGSPYIFWKAFAHEQHLDLAKIPQVTIAAPGYAQMAQGSVDFLANFYSAASDLQAKGVPVVVLRGASFGQVAYGLSIYANSGWLSGHQQAAREFLLATAEGMAWSKAHPTQGLQMEAQANPALTSTTQATAANLTGFQDDASLWTTSSQPGVYLTFTTSGLQSTQKVLYDGGVLSGTPFTITGSLWTSRYLPAPSQYAAAAKAP